MVVNRRTFHVKPGHMDEVVQLIKNNDKAIGTNRPPVGAWRLYTPIYGAFNTLVMEVEFETPEQCEKYWNVIFALPIMPGFFEKWDMLVEGRTNELWELR